MRKKLKEIESKNKELTNLCVRFSEKLMKKSNFVLGVIENIPYGFVVIETENFTMKPLVRVVEHLEKHNFITIEAFEKLKEDYNE